jgi:myo-inositol catabolism protein IolC
LHNVGLKVDGRLYKNAMGRIAGLGAQLPRPLTFNGTSTLRVEELRL